MFDPPQACHVSVRVSKNSRTHPEYDLTSMRKSENAMKDLHPSFHPDLFTMLATQADVKYRQLLAGQGLLQAYMLTKNDCPAALSAAAQKLDLAWPPSFSLLFLQLLLPSNTRVAHSSRPLRPNSIVFLKT